MTEQPISTNPWTIIWADEDTTGTIAGGKVHRINIMTNEARVGENGPGDGHRMTFVTAACGQQRNVPAAKYIRHLGAPVTCAKCTTRG